METHGIVLFFMFTPGCVHCEASLPHVNAFTPRANARGIVVVRRDLTQDDFRPGGWRPKATPAWAVLVDGRLIVKTEGTLELAGIEALIDQALARLPT